MRINLDIAGDRQLSRELLRVGERGQDMRPAFTAIGTFWLDETREQFNTEGGHASGGWKPLAPETVRRKALAGLDPRILRATGALFTSLTERGRKGSLLRITKNELRFGSTLPYAAVHQRPKASNRLPQRRPVELTEAARKESVRILQRWIVTGKLA